jgi:dihydropteroate synthase
MELRLGHQVFRPGDFVLWHDIAPDAAPLLGDRLAGEAAARGAGLVCRDPEHAVAAGVRPDRVILDAGTMPVAAQVTEGVASGYPVLVTLARRGDQLESRPEESRPEDGGGEGGEQDVQVESADPGLLAAASVYAWLGVRVFRTESGDAGAVRQVLDMVASIKGTRPPALSRRALG